MSKNSLSDRLVRQLLLQKGRELELSQAAQTFKLRESQRSAQEQELQSARDHYTELLNKKATVDAALDAIAQDTAAMAAQNEEDRKALMADLEKTVAEVNARVESTTSQSATLLHEAHRLNEQIKIIENHKASGHDKYKEIISARQSELASIDAQRLSEEEALPILNQKTDQLNVLDETLSAERAFLEERVAGYTSKVSTIQEDIHKVKKVVDDASATRERLIRRIKVAQSERKESMMRANRSRQECERETATTEQFELKVAQLQSQIDKLNTLTQSFNDKLSAK